MSDRVFRDRRDAGRSLAGQLEHFREQDDVVVLALPRGGVPVAYEVASSLGAPLDVFLVRKLGAPGREELAMGAIASGGIVVVNDDVVRGLGVTPEDLQHTAEREWQELTRREDAYREGRPVPDLAGMTVILVDDGLATGASMQAAILAVRQMLPARVVVAVPAAPESTCEELSNEVDEVVCATTPSPFFAVGESYWDFTQVSDDEVRDLLRAAWSARPTVASPRGQSEVASIRSARVPLDRPDHYDDSLLDTIGDEHFVLIGEASHGTHEFYETRARITQQLIEDRGFCAVVCEADWPDAYQVNRWVRGRSDDATAEEALRGFARFPTWMWRNTVVLDFVGWLREHNAEISGNDPAQAGFYGMDLYSLHRSVQEVIAYLERVDPEAAARARERYSCFDHYGQDGQEYGLAAAFGGGETCERGAVEQLIELQRRAAEYASRDGLLAEDEFFYAEQNAKTVTAAEEYYRTMFHGRVSSWNQRDCHMVDTLEALCRHLSRQRGEQARVVVWAHNSHLGDARATEMGAQGEVNVGQLVRERHRGDCRLIGFTTYTGTVTAANDWGGTAERMNVRPGLPGSYEELMHELGEDAFAITFDRSPRAADALRSARLGRAIGVIYRPITERQSHYFRARLADQFDTVIHIDRTRALEPLERTGQWEEGEVPETYPTAV